MIEIGLKHTSELTVSDAVTAQQMAEEFEIESWHHYYARAVACANQYR